MWWIDYAATTHINVSMRDFLSCRKQIDGERYIYVGDGKSVEVEAIQTFRLLRIEFYLGLNETFIVPSFRRNLISISALNKFKFSCSFGNSKFSLFQDSKLVGTSPFSSYDHLYLLDTIASFKESLHLSTRGIKRKLTTKNSATLWHKQFGHTSKQRIERLVSDKILNPLDFTDFDICVNCIKGK